MDEAYSNSSPSEAANPSRSLATDGVRAEVAMGRLVGRDSPLDGVRVLLVESHVVVREVISRLLVDFGAVVTATAGVTEALEAFEREGSDVVLSDIGMGDEDGYALIRKLRALPRDRGGQTPAAGLTGLSAVEHRDRVLQSGFQYYVAKPVDARLLVSVVASLAARSVAARMSGGRTPLYRRSERGTGTTTARSTG